jgi:hypothetical protein
LTIDRLEVLVRPRGATGDRVEPVHVFTEQDHAFLEDSVADIERELLKDVEIRDGVLSQVSFSHGEVVFAAGVIGGQYKAEIDIGAGCFVPASAASIEDHCQHIGITLHQFNQSSYSGILLWILHLIHDAP